MGSKTQLFQTEFLEMTFVGSSSSGIGDTTGIAGLAGPLYVSLHADNPNDYDDLNSVEVHYVGYARQPLYAADWIVSGSQVSNRNAIVFPEQQPGEAPSYLVSFKISQAASSGAIFLYAGLLDPATNYTGDYVTPIIPAGGLVISED